MPSISVNVAIGSTVLGPVYTRHQRQCCDNSGIMLAILFLLKTMGLLQNGVATYFQGTPLFSMRTVLLDSLQSCCCIDADDFCKQPLIETWLWFTVNNS